MLVKRMLAILGPLLCNLRASYLIQINSKIFISVEQRSWKREEDSKRRLGSWPLWDSKYLPLGPHSVSSYFSSSQCTHPHIKVLDCLLTGELNFSEMDVLLGLIRMFLLRTRNCKMCQLVVCECVFKYQLCVCALLMHGGTCTGQLTLNNSSTGCCYFSSSLPNTSRKQSWK